MDVHWEMWATCAALGSSGMAASGRADAWGGGARRGSLGILTSLLLLELPLITAEASPARKPPPLPLSSFLLFKAGALIVMVSPAFKLRS